MAYSDSGLPGMLFSLLDQEEDEVVMRHAQQTITSILVTMAATSLSTWLSLCKEVLTVSVDVVTEGCAADEREEDDDNAEFTHGEDSSAVAMVQPRWGTRVFAAVCLRKIIQELSCLYRNTGKFAEILFNGDGRRFLFELCFDQV